VPELVKSLGQTGRVTRILWGTNCWTKPGAGSHQSWGGATEFFKGGGGKMDHPWEDSPKGVEKKKVLENFLNPFFLGEKRTLRRAI